MADYDGDGLVDLVSGSACCQRPNCFYLFRRLKGGGFAERRRVNLRFPEGMTLPENPINGLRSKVAVADWNGDGVHDVLVGGSNSRFVGVAHGPLGAKDEVSLVRLWPKGEEPLTWVSTNPCVADWDGDGRPDLILGGYRGGPGERLKAPGVYWFRNVGTKREPKLAEPKRLVAVDNLHRLTGISVGDWNGDGRLDLIAARKDYETTGPEKNKSTLRHHKVWVYLRVGPGVEQVPTRKKAAMNRRTPKVVSPQGLIDMISSRTPGGPPARCPVCGALCRSDPSLPPEDVPCPECGSLLWLAPAEQRKEAAYVHTYRFLLGDAFRSWVGGVSGRLGCPTPQECEFLERIETWDQARLLKELSRDARNWADLIEQWNLLG